MEHLFSIMGLDTDYVDEICIDIKEQYEKGITTCPLFCMTLVPEGNPPADKVGMLTKKYLLFKEKLDKLGIPSGVLVQATIGHGWVLGEMFPYQRYTGIINGLPENVVCPYDEGFREYIYNVFRTIATCHPTHIMVDDDFRQLGRTGGGCGCPLHIKRFNELMGTNFTREELFNKLKADTEGTSEYTKIFLETQKEAVTQTAEFMRKGIDSIDPNIPASFCSVGYNLEFGSDIAKILSGKNNPVVLRLSHGNFAPAGARFFSRTFFKAAAQMAKNKDKVDIFLAETDTCPQNRYSTSAYSLHTHFTGSILEGTKGAKHWITRLSCFEPESGKAYRKILSKYKGFYESLSNIANNINWFGCRIPVLKEAKFIIGKSFNLGEDYYNGWGECVLERLGIPMYFSADNGGALCLEGKVKLTDSEIKEALKGTVILASDSAKDLIERNFGEYLGVDVKEWGGKSITTELILESNKTCSAQVKAQQLITTSEKTTVDSMLCNEVTSLEHLFPGCTVYKNSLGGTVITFAGTPRTNYNIVDAFSFLNESRKNQFVRLLKDSIKLPLYYKGDEEMYLKAGYLPNGTIIVAAFNIGLDHIDEIEFEIFTEVNRLEILLPNGNKENVEFTKNENTYTLKVSAHTLEPQIFFIS